MIATVLFLLFTVVPVVETYLIIEVGSRLGALETVGTLVLAGLLGAWLGKRAGGTVLREIFEGLRRGEPPAVKLVEGLLALVGAVLLVTPGYLSDVVGILLLWAPVRRWLAPRVKDLAWAYLSRRGFTFVGDGAAGPAMRARQEAEKKFDHPVVE
ncbi:MAG: FxsA family protein [Deltaproteobacteria bacterium]|nr:FxsA family protein [Deltaproteobacteria bacterium]